MKQRSVLILEDDKLLAESLKQSLIEKKSYLVFIAHNLDQAFELIDNQQIELLIADWILSNGETSLELIEYVGQYLHQTKILMLTCKEKCNDRLLAYKKGVDAYLSKPFNLDELLFVVSRLFNSYKLKDTNTIETEQLSLFPDDGYVLINNSKVYLRPKEMMIFKTLFLNKSSVISKQKLLDLVWPNIDNQPNFNTVEVYIRRLRQILGPYGINLKNKRGYGYCFVPEIGIKH